MEKKAGSNLWLAIAIVFAFAGGINWWRAIDEGVRGWWLVPAICFTAGAVIGIRFYVQGRSRSRNR